MIDVSYIYVCVCVCVCAQEGMYVCMYVCRLVSRYIDRKNRYYFKRWKEEDVNEKCERMKSGH